MKNVILASLLVISFTGCQQKPAEQGQAGIQQERKEAAKKLFAQGILLLQQQDIKGAIETLGASIKVDPTDPNAYLVLGQILIQAQQYDQAVEFLDQTAKNFPDNGAVFYMLSTANRMAKKPLPAVLAARRSFEIFKAASDEENARSAAILLEGLIKEAQEEQSAQEKAAQKPNQE